MMTFSSSDDFARLNLALGMPELPDEGDARGKAIDAKRHALRAYLDRLDDRIFGECGLSRAEGVKLLDLARLAFAPRRIGDPVSWEWRLILAVERIRWGGTDGR